MYAAVFGFFAFSWFGWAQDSPPKPWRVWLGVASVVSLMTALFGGFLALKNWDAATALNNDAAYQSFGIIVGIEFLLAGLGAAALAWRKRTDYIAAWIAVVVGVHFVPLASVFKDGWLYVLAALLVSGVCVAVLTAKAITKTTATCVVAGSIIYIFALRGVLLAVL